MIDVDGIMISSLLIIWKKKILLVQHTKWFKNTTSYTDTIIDNLFS